MPENRNRFPGIVPGRSTKSSTRVTEDLGLAGAHVYRRAGGECSDNGLGEPEDGVVSRDYAEYVRGPYE